MPKKEIIQVIRIFKDGKAELLEGDSLINFLNQEAKALSLLESHSWVGPGGEVHWVSLKKVLVEKYQ